MAASGAREIDEMQKPQLTIVKLDDFVQVDHSLAPVLWLANQALKRFKNPYVKIMALPNTRAPSGCSIAYHDHMSRYVALTQTTTDVILCGTAELTTERIRNPFAPAPGHHDEAQFKSLLGI